MTPRKQLEQLRSHFSRHLRFHVHMNAAGGLRAWNQPDNGRRMAWVAAKRHARRDMTLVIDVVNPARRWPFMTELRVKIR